MPDCTKSRSIWKFRDSSSISVFFSKDDESGVGRFLDVPYELWADMGRPSIITVTIRPGDKLNA